MVNPASVSAALANSLAPLVAYGLMSTSSRREGLRCPRWPRSLGR
jgi:hypothetical protein